MKAAVLEQIGRPLAIRDIERPTVGPDEVLVETHTCGICRTDIHMQDGLAYVPALPHVPGHEPAGVVVEVGRDARGVRVGDRVVPHLFVCSRDCAYTRAGQHAQATHLEGIIGVTLPGGFAQYFRAPVRNVLRLPDDVSFAEGGLATCAIVTAVHAFRRARLGPGDLAVVIGIGGIGLVMVQLLKAAGVRVAAVSRSAQSRELARREGAELCLGIREAPGPVKAASDGYGAACAFDMVGLAETMGIAAECVRAQGQIVVVGEEPQFPAIDTIRIAQRELEITGSRNGGLQDAMDALQMMSRRIIRPHIDRRLPLGKVNEGLEYLRSGQAHGRLVIEQKPE